MSVQILPRHILTKQMLPVTVINTKTGDEKCLTVAKLRSPSLREGVSLWELCLRSLKGKVAGLKSNDQIDTVC